MPTMPHCRRRQPEEDNNNSVVDENTKKARAAPEMDTEMHVEERSGTGSIMDVLRNSMQWRKSQAFHQAKIAQQAFQRGPP